MCLDRTQRPTSSKEELHPVLKQDSVILFRILVLKFMQAYGNDSVTFPFTRKNVAGCLLVFIWPCDNKRKRIQRSRSRKCYIRFQRLCPFQCSTLFRSLSVLPLFWSHSEPTLTWTASVGGWRHVFVAKATGNVIRFCRCPWISPSNV